MKKIIFGLLLLTSSTITYAEGDLKGLFSAGFTLGGEDLATSTTGQSVTTAGFMYLSAGGLYNIQDTDFSIQAAVGYNYDSITASNGTFSFSEKSFEIIPFYRVDEKMKIGIGLFNVLSARYSGTSKVTFGSVSGPVVEMNWTLSSRASWGIRYVSIDLPYESFNGIDVSSSGITEDGSSFGIVYYGHF